MPDPDVRGNIKLGDSHLGLLFAATHPREGPAGGVLEPTSHYITTQEEHHKKRTFQDEYRTLLRKYGVEWDERYVWD